MIDFFSIGKDRNPLRYSAWLLVGDNLKKSHYIEAYPSFLSLQHW
jgi:hypothetical protein